MHDNIVDLHKEPLLDFMQLCTLITYESPI